MKKRTIIVNTSLLLASIVITIVLFEIGIRLFVRDLKTEPHPKFLYISDPDISYRNNPNFTVEITSDIGTATIEINSQSLRDEKDYGEKGDNTYRILVLGDSQTFNSAIHNELTYPKIVEQFLNERYQPEKKFEVLNAGVIGYNTANEAAFLEKYGPMLDPDMVIVGFYINDIVTNKSGVYQSEVKDGYLVSTDKINNPYSILPYPIKRFLRERSHLYYYIMWRLNLFLGNINRPVTLDLYDLKSQEKVKDDWTATYGYLEKIISWTESRNLSLAVVYIPRALQIENDLWKLFTSDGGMYDRTLPIKTLASYLEERHMHLCDPYPSFLETQPTTPLFGLIDKHLNQEGNRLLAEILFEHLIEYYFQSLSG